MSVVANYEQMRDLCEQILDLKNREAYWKQRAMDLEIALLRANEGAQAEAPSIASALEHQFWGRP